MKLYHVVVEIHGEKKPLFLFGDLSESDLRKRFLNPYYLGKPVLKKNQIVDLSRVASVHIRMTKSSAISELEDLKAKSKAEIDELNRGSGMVFIGFGRGYADEDIVECGIDVTAKFINAPPGQGTGLSKFAGVLHNPWVLRVGGGTVLIIIGFLLAKQLGS